MQSSVIGSSNITSSPSPLLFFKKKTWPKKKLFIPFDPFNPNKTEIQHSNIDRQIEEWEEGLLRFSLLLCFITNLICSKIGNVGFNPSGAKGNKSKTSQHEEPIQGILNLMDHLSHVLSIFCRGGTRFPKKFSRMISLNRLSDSCSSLFKGCCFCESIVVKSCEIWKTSWCLEKPGWKICCFQAGILNHASGTTTCHLL